MAITNTELRVTDVGIFDSDITGHVVAQGAPFKRDLEPVACFGCVATRCIRQRLVVAERSFARLALHARPQTT
jgi:hypothetical protein